ncbi:26S protease regulatory subunit 10B A [Cinnamomum micranthum f. kanehirae]|uniref:26S protease regulatory subunit 10B A n=2 Tax=Magnoliopsida TaxID=3398 RepID=A0A3S3PT02_9MAGN|nr:26S protease regulatory subunit 10B A [Cinnamomum micranthum f. kanehirae]
MCFSELQVETSDSVIDDEALLPVPNSGQGFGGAVGSQGRWDPTAPEGMFVQNPVPNSGQHRRIRIRLGFEEDNPTSDLPHSEKICLTRQFLTVDMEMNDGEDAARLRTAVAEYRKKLLQQKELESKVRSVRENLRASKKEFSKTEDDLKSLQSVGQIIGEILRHLDNELIVKASSGPRYVVGCRSKVDKEKLTSGTRVVLDMTTLTIMRALPREVDPVVYNMLHEDPGNVSYSAVGGLSDQIRELRESIELPLMNPELFIRVGIKPPKGVLLYGPPGTGKTLLARAIASNIDANFLKVVSSAIIDKYIGESARLIREMFGYARDHQPCIIFMDEIDAIGGRRFSEGTSADREIQRTLMELLNQLDGFDQLGKVKMIMATNRPDVLDPALLRPGRLDRKIEIPLPNEQSRMEILKIHAAGIAKHGEIDYEAVVKLAEGFNGADLRNVCTEAGMSAIRAERDYVIHEDFMKAVRKLNEAKKLESTAHYNTDFGKE